MAPARLELGRIGRPHGVRGEVTVVLVSNRSERTAPGAVMFAGDRELDELLPALRAAERKTSPLVGVPAVDARGAHWVTPSRVGEVSIAEWTSTGRLRQPSWRGWRPDKSPDDVVREG